MPEEVQQTETVQEGVEGETLGTPSDTVVDEQKVTDALKSKVPGFFNTEVEALIEGSEVDESNGESTPAEESGQVESQTVTENTNQAKETETKPEEGEKETKNKTEIPEAHARALEHVGWKPEDIQKLHEADPTLLQDTAKRAYDADQRSNQLYRQAGQNLLGGTTDTSQQETTSEQKVVDVAKLREQYTDADGEVSDTVKPLLDAVEAMSQQVQQLSTGQQQIVQQVTAKQQAEQEQTTKELRQELDQFLGGVQSTGYKEFYGDSWDSAAPTQIQNRITLSREAGIVSAGMYAYGDDITYPEALSRAHSLLVAPLVERKIIDGIKGTLQKRSNNLVLDVASTQQSQSDKAGKKSSPTGSPAKVAEVMRKIGLT